MSELAPLQTRFPAGVALRDSVTVIELGEGYQFVAPEPFQLVGPTPERRELLNALKAGARWPALHPLLGAADARIILLELDRRGLLIERLEPWREGAQEKQLSWLAHFVAAPALAQQRLRQEHALIVGAGGTGGIIVQHLASIGVGSLTLVDYDKVELSNFNRQLPFRRADIGAPKVEALKEHVLERHPECVVVTQQARIGHAQDLLELVGPQPPSVVFCCADVPVGKINASVARAAATWEVPCIFGSVGVMDGAVGPLLHGSSPATSAFIAAMDELGALGERIIGKAAMGASFSPVNTLVAVHMVLEWTKSFLQRDRCQVLDRSIVLDCEHGTRRVEWSWPPAPDPALE